MFIRADEEATVYCLTLKANIAYRSAFLLACLTLCFPCSRFFSTGFVIPLISLVLLFFIPFFFFSFLRGVWLSRKPQAFLSFLSEPLAPSVLSSFFAEFVPYCFVSFLSSPLSPLPFSLSSCYYWCCKERLPIPFSFIWTICFLRPFLIAQYFSSLGSPGYLTPVFPPWLKWSLRSASPSWLSWWDEIVSSFACRS